MGTQHEIVLATRNAKKVHELRLLFADLPVVLRPLDDVVTRELVVVEDGATFVDNAVKKARAVAEATGMLALADDSGLEVDALGGAPGVRSARYAGERATDAENNAALLAALEALGDPLVPSSGPFPARFRCALALVDPMRENGEPYVVEGTCEGQVTRAPAGGGGFGYDPLFVVAGSGDGGPARTMAELSDDEKNRVSHRGKAVATMRLVLEKVLAERDAITDRVLARRG